jgi:hypothetical protein
MRVFARYVDRPAAVAAEYYNQPLGVEQGG